MKVTEFPIAGLKLIEPKVFGDERGFFQETWNRKTYENVFLPTVGTVLRGLRAEKATRFADFRHGYGSRLRRRGRHGRTACAGRLRRSRYPGHRLVE